MSEAQKVEIKVLDKQIELTHAKTAQINTREKWRVKLAEEWGKAGIKIGFAFICGLLAGISLLRIVLIFFGK